MKSELPLEIEKKFLIKMPDLEWIKMNTNCTVANIFQTYLGFKKDGYGDRVRKMIIDNQTKYYHTSKKSLTDMTRIELENEITEEEYLNYLRTHRWSKTLFKTRYIVKENNLKYEIDIYPFWTQTAILEIELKSEDEQYTLPDFVEVIGDVTGNKDYSNSSLVSKYLKKK